MQKKAQEVARYALPVSICAYLYHTVSALTLLRYHRLADQFDTALEQRLLVQAMLDEVLKVDPLFARVVEDAIPIEETPEVAAFTAFADARARGADAEFRREFDASLGGRTSKLVGSKPGQSELVAQSVREVLGLPRAALGDVDALALVLSPAKNPLLGGSLNVRCTAAAALSQHAHYSFRETVAHRRFAGPAPPDGPGVAAGPRGAARRRRLRHAALVRSMKRTASTSRWSAPRRTGG